MYPILAQIPKNETIDLFEFWEHARRYVAKRVHSWEMAEDIASQAVVKILTAEQRDNGSIRHWRAFAWSIVRHLLIDHYRQQQRHVTLRLDTLLADSEKSGTASRALLDILCTKPFDEDVHNQIEVEHIFKIVTLTPEQAQVIEWILVQGYKPAEVAQAIGKTEGAIKALLNRGRVKLRRTREERIAA